MRMQIDKSIEDRLQNRSNLVLSKFFLGDVKQIDNTTCVTVLEYNPKIIVFDVGTVVLDNMMIVTKSKDLYLLFNRSQLG